MITLSRAVYLNCLDCSGRSPKEVTLCPCVSCPLWAFRCGYSIKTTRYKKRMDNARKRFGDEFIRYEKAVSEGISGSDFTLRMALCGVTDKKTGTE